MKSFKKALSLLLAVLMVFSAAAVTYYNRIDIGIYLCILEICMNKKGIGFTRELFTDNGGDAELTKVAEYLVKEK